MFNSMMISDIGQWILSKINIPQKVSELTRLFAAGINTVYFPLDLPTGPNSRRPHIQPGRTLDRVRDDAVFIIKALHQHGFKVMVTLGNEPSVRSGRSAQMAGVAFLPGLTQWDLYVDPRHINAEKQAYTDLLQKCGDSIAAIVLYLEPSTPASIPFTQALAMHIRAQGFKGTLFSNGIGAGAWSAPEHGVYAAHSRNTLDDYKSAPDHLRNSDGIKPDIDAGNAAEMIGGITGNPGSHGYVLYIRDYKGLNGPSTLQDWMWRFIR